MSDSGRLQEWQRAACAAVPSLAEPGGEPKSVAALKAMVAPKAAPEPAEAAPAPVVRKKRASRSSSA